MNCRKRTEFRRLRQPKLEHAPPDCVRRSLLHYVGGVGHVIVQRSLIVPVGEVGRWQGSMRHVNSQQDGERGRIKSGMCVGVQSGLSLTVSAVNYRQNAKLCEVFDYEPCSYDEQQDCAVYKVNCLSCCDCVFKVNLTRLSCKSLFIWKKRPEATQTLRAGCSEAEPKVFGPPQTHGGAAWGRGTTKI